MATAKQIAANRRNALRSTGPRTAAGRFASSRNALRHGLTARRAVVCDEDAHHFQRFRAEMRTALAPRGAREELLAETAVEAAWRLRRAARAEAAFFNRAGSWDEAFSDDGRELDALRRYEVAADRAFHRALALLERGRAGFESGATPPPYPPPRGGRGILAGSCGDGSDRSPLPLPLEGEGREGGAQKNDSAKRTQSRPGDERDVRAACAPASPPAAGRATGHGRWRYGPSWSRPCRGR